MDDEPDPLPRPSGNTTHPLVVEIHDPDQLLGRARSAWLKDTAAAVCIQLNHAGEVRVRVVDDQRMRETHAQYSGLNSTTDVLTFDLTHGDDLAGKVLDTDLVVCFDEASRQAAQREHSPEHELLLYIVHGVLHCLGYDDHDEESFARMHAREDELFELAGLTKLFDAPAAHTNGDRS